MSHGAVGELQESSSKLRAERAAVEIPAWVLLQKKCYFVLIQVKDKVPGLPDYVENGNPNRVPKIGAPHSGRS